MYQCAEICFPRKKKVIESFHSNTYRIFDENVPERLDSHMVYKDHVFPSRRADEINRSKTRNNPQPLNVEFIRTNVRWLNAPFLHMKTRSASADQSQWWPNGSAQSLTPKAPYSRDSVQRSDFQAPPHRSTPCTRGGCNPHTSPASAIVPSLGPVSEHTALQEHMSFIQQYDSRRLRDQPYRGKRHGAFVWGEVTSPNRRPCPGGPTGEGASLHSELSHSPVAGGNATPPQHPPTPSSKLFCMVAPLSEVPLPKHRSSDWVSVAAAPTRRDRGRSLESCRAALPPLSHAGRNSLP